VTIAVTACYRVETRWMRPRDGVLLVRTPIGPRAPEALEALSERSDVSMILSTGFCGGLQDGLATGDLVLADVIRHGGEEIVVS
jgi:nucleoside phosphorylase